LADLYNNYKVANICRSVEEICAFIPNPCCLHFNSTNPNKCGEGYSCYMWTDDLLSWERPGILRFLLIMPVQFLVLFTAVLIYEAGYMRILFYKLSILLRLNKKPSDEQIRIEEEYGDIKKDDDVIKEEARISEFIASGEYLVPASKEMFLVDRLTKYYSGFMAVKGVSFALKHGECFGLLGVNGAGKTTTFKMITGEELITYGDSYLNRTNLKRDIKKVGNFRFSIKKTSHC
jgi:ATP-binding cassette subfamily A (ABC1) protein 3